jgi:hypothetical protein
MLYPEEISMIVSSDPANGAINRSKDGSAFEIQFNGDALAVPKDAINVNVKVEEATVWWVIPNIESGINDKMYISGSAQAETISSIDLGFDQNVVIGMLSGGSTALVNMSITLGVDPPMPLGVFLVGDSLIIDSGALSGNSYVISSVNLDTVSSKLYEVIPSTDNLATGVNSFSRYRAGLAQSYIVTIPTGLYDLSGLNNTIQRELEAQGAKTDPAPLISFSPDDATQKVQMRLNYADVSVDFTQSDTPRDILGFASAVYGPEALAPIDLLAPNTAGFNTVNYFLIQSDLVQRGIRFNNVFNQTIAQVLINVAPGSQIVSTPFNPAKTSAQELAGAKRSNLRFRLTDDRGNPVNTNSEYWSCRIVVEYLRPLVLDMDRASHRKM